MSNASSNINDPSVGGIYWARVAAAVVEESEHPSDERPLVDRVAARLDIDPVQIPGMVAVAFERGMFVDGSRQGAQEPQLTWKARWLLERVGDVDERSTS